MKKFISVGILLFPTQGDQKMWLEKWNTFYSPKAIEFLNLFSLIAGIHVEPMWAPILTSVDLEWFPPINFIAFFKIE